MNAPETKMPTWVGDVCTSSESLLRRSLEDAQWRQADQARQIAALTAELDALKHAAPIRLASITPAAGVRYLSVEAIYTCGSLRPWRGGLALRVAKDEAGFSARVVNVEAAQ